MVHVSEILDTVLLDQMLAEGYVRVQKHPRLPLYIYNYTEKAQFDKRWNDATLSCRGLILTENGKVVARPWKKFFNYGEGRLKIDDVMPVEVTDKMDGSLGILYWEDDGQISWHPSIATRGSFNSDQALHAKKVLFDKYCRPISDEPYAGRDYAFNVDAIDEYTFLFEIVYPENRIVLNYGDMDDLVLLGAVHKERGYYLGPLEAQGVLGWDGPVTEVFPYKNMAEAFAAPPRPNAEGFVVRSGTEIVKIKQVDYIELHRIVTNLTPLSLWRRLAAGQSLDDLLETIPDEWHEWLRKEYTALRDKFNAVEKRVLDRYLEVLLELGAQPDRKTFAKFVASSPDKKYMFTLLDMKDIEQMIWTEIRPKPTEKDELDS